MIRLVNAEKDARLNILDIGSGHGRWPPHASTRFECPCYRLDISDAMMAEGYKRMVRFGDRFRYMVVTSGLARYRRMRYRQGLPTSPSLPALSTTFREN